MPCTERQQVKRTVTKHVVVDRLPALAVDHAKLVLEHSAELLLRVLELVGKRRVLDLLECRSIGVPHSAGVTRTRESHHVLEIRESRMVLERLHSLFRRFRLNQDANLLLSYNVRVSLSDLLNNERRSINHTAGVRINVRYACLFSFGMPVSVCGATSSINIGLVLGDTHSHKITYSPSTQ